MIKLDMRNKICPYPVIETKKALKTASENETITVIVDNKIATENLEKMANELGFKESFKIVENSSDEYVVTFIKGSGLGENSIKESITNTNENNIIVISSDCMGSGDIELSKKLIEGFIYSLTEQDEDLLPTHLIFYNRGVFLTCDNKKTIDDILILQSKGVNVMSCGLCVDFYGFKDSLKVGEITNMYNISKLLLSNNVININ